MTAPGVPGGDVQVLLRAARRDGPSEASRQAMFARIAAQTAGAAAAAPLASKLFGSLAGKLALGVVSLATLAGLALWVAPRVSPPVLGPAPVLTIDRSGGGGAGADASGAASGDELGADGWVLPSSLMTLESHAPPSPGRKEAAVAVDGDAIEREARWVAEARTALMRGEPSVAATKARAARALPSKALEPEELRILGRALRVMGDDKGADAAFNELVAKYPEEALRP